MTELSRAVVVAGGLTYERDVSLRSGRRVTDALRHVGVEVTLADADSRLLSLLADLRPDAVLIALHGGSGEDGAVRAVLDCAGVPYVGTTPAACRTAFDKPSAKALVRRAGVETPDWVAVGHATFRELGAPAVLDLLVGRLGLPLMVKPAAGGSALGATAVRDIADLPAAMVTCFSYGDTALVERYVEGIEVAVSVLELDGAGSATGLPPVEIRPDSGVYDYAARYTAGATEFFCPARVDSDTTAELTRVALAVHATLGLRDLSRTDLRIDRQGVVQFLDTNVAPGMTETSLLPLALAASGRDLGIVCRDLLAAAAVRGPAR
ncbi:MAG TPA: D-alanine--D-alanine ligase [Mycobacteriales bacterium]